MRTLSTLIIAALAVVFMVNASQADLVISETASVNNLNYDAGDFFTGVNVNVGDYLVIAHSNNKRDNGSNTISATFGSNTFTALSGGDAGSGGGAGAWIFYSQITDASATAIDLATTNGTKSVSHATNYWVIRADAGEQVTLVGSAGNAGKGVSSLDLNIPLSPNAVSGLGFAAGSTGLGGTGTSEQFGTDPAQWTSVAGGNVSRKSFLADPVDGANWDATFNIVDSSGSSLNANVALAGVVFTSTTAVPEPTSLVWLPAMLVGLGLVRRKK